MTLHNKLSPTSPLSSDHLYKMNAYWRPANYLSVGQRYLQDSPMLDAPLREYHKIYISELGDAVPEAVTDARPCEQVVSTR
jgi:phosphoketolase